MADFLASALELHQSGQLGAAAQLYQKVLAREQSNADALHLLGVLKHQQGEHLVAVELIGRAIALQPREPRFHANAAEAYRALGRWEDAQQACRKALAIKPDYPEALCNLGLALHGMGNCVEAIAQFERAIALRPDCAAYYNNIGIAFRDLGGHSEAIKQFRKAVELEPGFAAAHANLGQSTLAQGRAVEALDHCKEAVRLQPDLAVGHHFLGTVYEVLDRAAEAKSAYLEALRLDSDLAESHLHLGLLLQKEGQLEEALPWIKNAVDLQDERAPYWQALAELHSQKEDYAAAIPCWERYLRLFPGDGAAPRVALGWALQEEGRPVEAEAQYRSALRINPNATHAYLNLGCVREEAGEMEEAEAAFRAALAAQPSACQSLGKLAMLLRGKIPPDDQAELERRLADPSLSGRPRSHLLYGLAHVLDAQKDYRRAAECVREANALSVQAAGDREKYHPLQHERFVARVKQECGEGYFARVAGAGVRTRRPVFIVGLPRSGTTLTEQILASHSRVHGAGELRLVHQAFESIPRVMGRTGAVMECLPEITSVAIRKLAEEHLSKLDAIDGGRSERIVDKMPDNYLYLGLVCAMFPDAVVIHCRRDLRDVAVSCWMTDFRKIRWSNTIEHIGMQFRQYRRIMDHWRAVLPTPIHEVQYEDAVGDLEGVARRLLDVCGLEWEPGCLEFHQTRRPIRTASLTQVRQPIYNSSVARWKNYERELSDLFELLEIEDTDAAAIL